MLNTGPINGCPVVSISTSHNASPPNAWYDGALSALSIGGHMTFTVLAHLFSTLLDFLYLFGRSDQEKDVEIRLVRQQVRLLQRTRTRPPRLAWWEKVPLAMLAGKLVQRARHSRARLSHSLLLFTPETVLRWHRELVHRKWTFRQRPFVGRPRIAAELEAL